MTDPKNLTSEELMASLNSDVRLGERAEIRRRLKELEEAQKLQERTDYMLNAVLLQAKQYKERLAKCEKENIQLRNALAEEQDASAAARAALEE